MKWRARIPALPGADGNDRRGRRAARASHERLYEVARGEAKPYDDAPEYLPLLFF